MSAEALDGRGLGTAVGEPLRLLVFDPVDGAFARAIAQSGRVAAVVTETVEEAVHLAADGGADAVVVDLETAGPGGLSSITSLRDGAPGVPIVVLTDEEGEHWGTEALRHGAEDHLVKRDASDRELARVVRQAVERSRLRHTVMHQYAQCDAIAEVEHAARACGSAGAFLEEAAGIIGSTAPVTGVEIRAVVDDSERTTWRVPDRWPADDVEAPARIRSAQQLAWGTVWLAGGRDDDALESFAQRVAGTLGAALDRYAASAALAATEQRLYEVADRARDGIYLRYDRGGTFAYVNPALEEITGFDREHIAVDPALLGDHVHPDDLPRVRAHLRRPDPQEAVRFRFHRPDDRTVWLELHQWDVCDEGGQRWATQGLVRDVTGEVTGDVDEQRALAAIRERERHLDEELRQAEGARDAILGSVSHELRTPLTTIYGIAETLAEHDDLDEDRRSALATRLASQTARLRLLVDDLLELQRVPAGADHPAPGACRLAAVAEDVAAHHPLNGRRLHVEVDADLTVPADPDRVRRVLTHLVDNLVRHTPPGSTAWICAREVGEDVEVVVEDDGPGVPEGLKPRVLSPFVQGSHVRAAARPGVGVGLALASRFAAAHGGRLQVADRPGGGARFTLRLPREASRPQRSGPDGDERPAPALRPPPAAAGGAAGH